MFKSEARVCIDCHRDPHLGQFAKGEPSKQCEQCHSVERWKPVNFVHNRDSKYPLLGKHKAVACVKCHQTEQNGTESFVRYKPLATDCRSCHGNETDSLRLISEG